MWVYYKDHLFKKVSSFLCFSLRIMIVSVKHQEKLIIVPALPIREKKKKSKDAIIAKVSQVRKTARAAFRRAYLLPRRFPCANSDG